jgi:hypothetical protein
MKGMATIGVVLLALALALGAGCAAEIGDDCGSNADCGVGRICDRSMPGGYCTSTPCEVNRCPTEAICVEFEDGQSYCMKHCGGNGDCRGGSYRCVTDYGDHPYCGIPFSASP